MGVSPEQAIGYCGWRNSIIKEDKTITFRLPSNEEWEYAAKGGNEQAIFPWEGTSMLDKKGNCRANVSSCIWNFIEEYDPYKSYITSPTDSYAPNAYDIYCMASNVAEIVTQNSPDEKTFVLKGGSYDRGTFYSLINFSGTYEKPARDIGFRCVCEVKEQ